MSSAATVFHVDDDPLVRRAVELVLRSVGLPCQGYSAVSLFLDAYREERPGCLVTDLRMPGLGGMELLRHCAARKIRLPVIVLTAHAEVAVAVAAMKAGVFDFLEKPCRDQQLLDSVQRALIEDERLRQERGRHETTAARLARLTPGELDVLEAVLRGSDNKSIAAALRVSAKTVEARRAKLMRKLEADTLAAMISMVLAYRHWAGSG